MPVLFGVRIHDISAEALIRTIELWLLSQDGHAIFTPNPEFLLRARRDEIFRSLLNKGDLLLADGVGLRFAAAALTQEKLVHRQTGVDTLDLLARCCLKHKKRILLFGGMDDVSVDAATTLARKHEGLDVVSLDPGFLPGDARALSMPESLLEEIRTMKPNVIAVGLGQGKQERCCLELLKMLPSVNIVIGVGGAFEMLSGRLPRAPRWMRQYGLEWLWRVLIEPSRLTRSLRASVVFPLVVIWDTLRLRRFWKAFFAVIHELRTLGKL